MPWPSNWRSFLYAAPLPLFIRKPSSVLATSCCWAGVPSRAVGDSSAWKREGGEVDGGWGSDGTRAGPA